MSADRSWAGYVASMSRRLDVLESFTPEALDVDNPAPELPTSPIPPRLTVAVRGVQRRIETLLPTLESRREDLLHEVSRLSAMRRPAGLQDHRISVGSGLDCTG